jgi:hypothetical protein
MIHLGVIQPVEKMHRPRAARSKTDADFSRKLGVSTRHERRHLFVAYLHIVDFVSGTTDGSDNSVDSITRKSIDTAKRPFVEALN